MKLRLLKKLISRGKWEILEKIGFFSNIKERKVDKIISQFGPNWSVGPDVFRADNYRPKDTDEVSETITESSDSVHGGDGNSAEVDHKAQTLAESRRSKSPTVGERDEKSRSCGSTGDEDEESSGHQISGKDKAGEPSPQDGKPDPGAGDPIQEGEGRPSSEDSCGNPSSTPASDEKLQSDSAAATISDDKAVPEQVDIYKNPQEGESGVNPNEVDPDDSNNDDAGDKEDNNGDIVTSQAPRMCYGGNTYTGAGTRPASRDVREVYTALRKLIRAFVIGTDAEDQSPRIDPKKLLRELISQRINLNRTRRVEMTPKKAVIMADVSGSCSACADATWNACLAIQASYPEYVVAIQHSNGYSTVHEYGTCAVDKEGGFPKPSEIGLVINFGDWDAYDLLSRIAKKSPLIWLDSFGKAGGPRLSKKETASLKKEFKSIVKYNGIGEAKTAAIALRDAIKWL